MKTRSCLAAVALGVLTLDAPPSQGRRLRPAAGAPRPDLDPAPLEAAGCRVETYRDCEISLKAEGGPTCLTRPILRR